MKPAKTTVAAVLILAVVAGPATAQTPPDSHTQIQAQIQSQGAPPSPPLPVELEKIRAAVNRPPAIRIENGQLMIYVEVIANWPSFAQTSKNFDYINGSSAKGANPMSHQEFLNMVTPRNMHSSAGVQPAEILTMAAVNYVGQWAVSKAVSKIATYAKEKQMRDIRERIDAELAAIKK